MKFYKIVGVSRDGKLEKRFASSKDEAASQRKDLNQHFDVPRDNIVTEDIEVEPNKAGILDALNNHC